MREPDAIGAPPPGGPRPPAPPATGDPGRRPDPADPGPAITVHLDGWLLGDLGHPRVDAKILAAIVLRRGPVGMWLRACGVTAQALDPPPVVIQTDIPLTPGVRRATPADLAALQRHDSQQWRYLHSLITNTDELRRRAIAVHLDAWPMGNLGSSETTHACLSAIVVRGGRITKWLTNRVGDVTSARERVARAVNSELVLQSLDRLNLDRSRLQRDLCDDRVIKPRAAVVLPIAVYK